MSDDAAPTGAEQNRAHLFQPGQSGNPAGRTKGSRNKLGEAFLAALHEDFQTNGADAIKRCREEQPAAYLRVVASILPKEIKVETSRDLSDSELDERIRKLASALEIAFNGSEGGAGGLAGGEEAPARPN